MTTLKSCIRPVAWCLSLAVILGAVPAISELLRQHYLPFHLYYNALLVLLGPVDRLLPITAGIVLCRLVWRRGNRSTGAARWLVRTAFLVPIAGLMSAYAWWMYRLGIKIYLFNVAAFLREQVAPVLLQTGRLAITPSGLCSIIAACALVLLVVRLRKRGQRARSRSPISWQTVGKTLSPYATGLLTTCTLVFLILHITTGAFQVRNAVGLREKPNIIFIMVDTLRADHVGCYGYDLPTTPNIDRFARESTRFTDPTAQAPWTSWSVASMMSSRYPDNVFAMTERAGMAQFQPYYPTLAEALREQGYATHAVISNIWLKRFTGFEQGFHTYDDEPAKINKEKGEQTSPSVTKRAVRELAALKKQKFFLYLLYFDAHQPYFRQKGYDYADSRQFRNAEAHIREENIHRNLEEAWLEPHRKYDSEIGFTDHYVGVFLDELKRQGLYDDTLIVFFSDHGEQFLEHGDVGHVYTLYDHDIRVPLLVKMPHQRVGRVVTGRFPLLDLYPSLLSYLHVDSSPLGLQGDAVNLASILRCAEKPIYSATVGWRTSIITGQYKLVKTNKTQKTEEQGIIRTQELYDLQADQAEWNNLLKTQPATVAKLDALLQHRDDRLSPADNAFWKSLTAQKRREPSVLQAEATRLRALGYIGGGD